MKRVRMEGFDARLVRAGERVCCAVSGGADSVAMLLAFAEANAAREPLGVVLSAVHVHHGLRGAEADGDEAFVRALCDGWQVPLWVERVDTAGRQASAGEGLEEAARELRYAVFRRALADGKADAVATAHTLDDQAETVMLKLLRGAWTEGLGGISPVVEMAAGEHLPGRTSAMGGGGGRIVRPLLRVRRAEVEAVLRDRGQPWREDASNRDLRLTRNRVRHELMPVLREFNPSVEEVLARTAAIAREDERYWKAETARLLPGLLLPGTPVRGGGRRVSTGVGERTAALEIERLKGFSAALRGRLVRSAAAALGCRIGADETAKLLALAGLAEHPGVGGRVGSRLELAGGLRAERSPRELRLSRLGTYASEDVGRMETSPPKPKLQG